MSPSVSVIIPTYNRKDSLKKTIESVLDQTLEDFELLICDDGSTDGTQEMVENIKDIRIRWIPGENSGGPASPRNRGIQASKSDWLALLDSDDLWLPEKLEKQFEAIVKYQVLAVCTNTKIMKNNVIAEDPYFKNNESRILKFNDMLNGNPVICSSMLIHKSIVQQMKGFPEDPKFRAIEDYALWMSSSMLTDIYYIDNPLVIYRDEAENSIRGENPKNVFQIVIGHYNRVLLESFFRVKYCDIDHMKFRKTILKQIIINFKKLIRVKFNMNG